MALTRAQLRRALPVLVRFFRYAKRRRPINTEDPITQEKLSFPVFFHVTETNTFASVRDTLQVVESLTSANQQDATGQSLIWNT